MVIFSMLKKAPKSVPFVKLTPSSYLSCYVRSGGHIFSKTHDETKISLTHLLFVRYVKSRGSNEWTVE